MNIAKAVVVPRTQRWWHLACRLLLIFSSFVYAHAQADWTARPPVNPALRYLGEFRVINWNASARPPDGHNMDTPPATIADFILDNALEYDANIITLQEMSYEALLYLQAGLGLSWDCRWTLFGTIDLYRDIRVTCVRGVGTNYRAERLENVGSYSDDLKGAEWWGYTQLEYFGVLVTNVHTRSHWAIDHVGELHREVTTGIVAGDFNHEYPDLFQSWFQTDLDRAPTLQDKKVDHILTVERPIEVDGGTLGEGGSNHEMLFARFRFTGTIIRPGPLPRP
jgi:hypothetical protein